MRILLVEDDADQAVLFAQVLEMPGDVVTTAVSAAEAQAQLAAAPFAVLLADWDLGEGMNGDALIRWCREHHPLVKTILFSNHPQVNEVVATCGADASFRKIEAIEKLRRLVAKVTATDAGQA